MFIMMFRTRCLVLLLVLAIFGVDIDYERLINASMLTEYTIACVVDVDKDTVTTRVWWLDDDYRIDVTEETFIKAELLDDLVDYYYYVCDEMDNDERRELIEKAIVTKLVNRLNLIKNLAFN